MNKIVGLVLVILLLSTTAFATTISDTKSTFNIINTSQIYFGNETSANGNYPVNRPLSSFADTYKTVGVGGNYATIQQAINDVPYFLSNEYEIRILDSAITYNENVVVPPVIVAGSISGTEGSVGALVIRGNCSNINAVKVKSFHFTSSQGAENPVLRCLSVTGQDDYSDENASIVVYGSQDVLLQQINLSGSTAQVGVVAYASGVSIANFDIGSTLETGFEAKHNGFFHFEQCGQACVPGFFSNYSVIGHATKWVYSNLAGVPWTIAMNNATAGIALTRNLNGNIYDENGNPYQFKVLNNNSYLDRLGSLGFQIYDSSASGVYFSLNRGGGKIDYTLSSAGNYMLSTSKNLNVGTSNAYSFIVQTNNTDRVTVNANGTVKINNLSGSGTAYVGVDATGLLYRTNATSSSNLVLSVEPNNGADIQTKIDACPTSGCMIFIPSGEYNLTQVVTTGGRNIPLYLVGTGISTQINLNNISSGFFRHSGSDTGTTIKNMYINGNNNNDTTFSFSVGEHNNTVIENILVTNVSHIVLVHNGTNLLVKDNNFVEVANGIVSNSYGDTTYRRTIHVINNRIINTIYNLTDNEGIDLNLHYLDNSYAYIEGNYIQGYRQDGMDLNVKNNIVSGNTIIDPDYAGINTSGILINQELNNTNSVISNNILLNVVGNGIYVSDNGSHSIVNNVIVGSNNGMGRGYGIRLTSSPTISVLGNSFQNLKIGISNEMSDSKLFTAMGNSYLNVTAKVSGNDISNINERTEFNSTLQIATGDLRVGNANNKGIIQLYGNSSLPTLFIYGIDNSGNAHINISSSANRTIVYNNTGTGRLDVRLNDGNMILDNLSGSGTAYVGVDATGLLYRTTATAFDGAVLNSTGGYSGQNLTRPMFTNASVTKTVCGAGCDYTTVQAAVDQIPYFVNHLYTITIGAGTYSENLWIPPLQVGDIISQTEGSDVAVKIQGNCSNINAVSLNSVHVTNNLGAGVTTVQCMKIAGKEPTSDENVSIAVYGSNQVQFAHLNMTATTVDYGIMAYASSVYSNDIYFNNQPYGYLAKRLSQMDIGDVIAGLASVYGTTSVALVNVNSGFVDIAQSNVTTPTLVDCGVKSGLAKYGKKYYCTNQFNDNLKNVTVQQMDPSVGGGYLWFLRNSGQDEALRTEITDADMNIVYYQDDDGNGAHNLNIDFKGSQNFTKSGFRVLFNGTEAFRVNRTGLKANDYFAGDGTQGFTGTCNAGTTLTVKNGLIVACS